MINYFKKQFPAYYLLIAVLMVSMVFFYILNAREKALRDSLLSHSYIPDVNNGSKSQNMNSDASAPNESSQKQTASNSSNPDSKTKNSKKIVRTSIGGLTRPILLVESPSPADEMSALNISLNEIVSKGKQSGKIHSASVYLQDMDNDNWTDVNDTEGYYPGSLMKLAVLICYLKKSETHPEVLTKPLTLEKNAIAPGQTYADEVIKPGIPYKTSDLLYQMIVKSDNFATLLLNRELDITELNQLFRVLGLPKMDMQNINYKITAGNYSKFMSVLYNSTYLNIKNSQYALAMMSHSTFNKGLVRNLPSNVVVAHKFGENVSGKVRELHESGIVYTGTRTYILTVMTKGERVSELAEEITEISDKVFKYFMP